MAKNPPSFSILPPVLSSTSSTDIRSNNSNQAKPLYLERLQPLHNDRQLTKSSMQALLSFLIGRFQHDVRLDDLRDNSQGLVDSTVCLPFTTLTTSKQPRSISRDLEFFDDTFASKSKSYFNESLEGLYNLYYAKYGNPTQSSQTSGGATSSKVSGGNKYSRLLSGLKAHTKKKARTTDPTMSSEYERYVNSDFVTHLHPKDFASFDVLGFWKEKEKCFPFVLAWTM
ncbi:hypothetical protein Tco_0433320 [Tanacetum coccineum]